MLELMMSNPNPQPLLGLRATLVLLLGALVGLGAGVLTVLSGGAAASAVLAGGAAFGAGVLFFHAIIA
ncbi:MULTISPECIES: hypothetical protein [unclassified Streptomyces]|uniref:hypothetical protein n=1 Tax=unclassified Streptomyces TaxID=2593676 RepID=UPI0022557CB8|nr:hypothetical protein [Streptomyces sp. NBC_00892]MCX4902461.1 hypothetical protein [Streptomyces sp. NBC_00892]